MAKYELSPRDFVTIKRALRLCFFIATDDKDWERAGQLDRLRKMLDAADEGWLEGEEIAAVLQSINN